MGCAAASSSAAAPQIPRRASCDWRHEDGAEDFWIARRGRLCDLTVVAAPAGEASPAAAAAAEAALIDTGRPVLLARARSVEIVTVEETGRPADPADLAEHLASHGIAAALDAAAAAAGATLVVMGGYTHGRLRELIFGGVTRHVLGACRLPTLLAH